jgi:TonB family protein
MGYQALLFCPEEKIARTVTQVLSELEFSVEPCAETFAAVKKLMAQHFDAIVVDCENEQNAALLFKSARNSASNQASLAVAVVEGQAGVAKAFRIGANLVLTKPINVEQAKGTLRVARGLLRKSEPVKSAAPPSTTGAAKSIPVAKATAPGAQALTAEEAPRVGQSRQGSHAAASAQTASARLSANAVPIVGVTAASENGSSQSVPEKSVTARSAPEVANSAESTAKASLPAEKRTGNAEKGRALGSSGAGISSAGTGAASAPALVRVAEAAESRKSPVLAESPASTESSTRNEAAGSTITAAPSFTFGDDSASTSEASGGRKKIMMAVAAAALAAVGLYAGWAHFHGKAPAAAIADSVASAPVTSSPDMARPSPPAPSPELKKPQPSPAVEAALSADKPHQSDISGESPQKNPSKAPASDSPHSAGPESEATTPVQAIVVKNGSSVSARRKTGALADAPAPSVIGLPATGGGSLPNLIDNPENAPAPVLQTLSVSQGVSQGLIVKKVQPAYPASALHMRMEGSVQLLATISKTGDIAAVKALNGEPVFARAAMDAVKQWKYKPYLLNGEPVEIQTQITVNFKLPR